MDLNVEFDNLLKLFLAGCGSGVLSYLIVYAFGKSARSIIHFFESITK